MHKVNGHHSTHARVFSHWSDTVLHAVGTVSFFSWNARSLLYDKRGPTLRKIRYVQSRAAHCSFVFLQEVRGKAGDRSSLEQLLPNFHFEFSHGEHRLAGGVAIGVRKEILLKSLPMETIEIVAGRCMLCKLRFGDATLALVNVHLEVFRTQHSCPTAFLRCLRGRLAQLPPCLRILGGDWNFIAEDDHRLDPRTGTLQAGSDSVASSFAAMFSDLAEVATERFTFQMVTEGRVSKLSRIDRWYTNLPVALLLDHRPRAEVCDNMFAVDATPSDHSGIRMTLAAPCRPRVHSLVRPRVPQWISRHAHFRETFIKLYNANHVHWHSWTPKQIIDALKDLLHAAARITKFHIANVGADSDEERLHWSLLSLRALRKGDLAYFLRCVKVDSGLQNSIDDKFPGVLDAMRNLEGGVTEGFSEGGDLFARSSSFIGGTAHGLRSDGDLFARSSSVVGGTVNGLSAGGDLLARSSSFIGGTTDLLCTFVAQRVADLSFAKLSAQLHAEHFCTDDDARKEPKPQRKQHLNEVFLSRVALWRRRSPRVVAQVIDADADVEHANRHAVNADLDEISLDRLVAHWSRAFGSVQCDMSTWSQFHGICKQVPRCYRWSPNKEQLRTIILSKVDSGPGPDGLPYSAWQAVLDFVIDHLWDGFEEIRRSQSFSDSELTSLMVFLIKELDNENLPVPTCSPGSTRPLQMSDTLLKSYVTLVNDGLNACAGYVVDHKQRINLAG